MIMLRKCCHRVSLTMLKNALSGQQERIHIALTIYEDKANDK